MCNIHWNSPKFQWTLRIMAEKRRCTIAWITVQQFFFRWHYLGLNSTPDRIPGISNHRWLSWLHHLRALSTWAWSLRLLKKTPSNKSMPFPQIKEYNSCNVRILEALLLSNTSHIYSIGKISSKRQFSGWFVFFEGFGPCLGKRNPTHPDFREISQKKFFWDLP